MVKYLDIYRSIVPLLGLIYSQVLSADVLRDPTKPPFSLLNPETHVEIPDAQNTNPILQSVTLGTHLKSAMIDGQPVVLGGRFKAYRLVSLSANKAVLQNVNGTQKVLTLSFSINKHQNTVSTNTQMQALGDQKKRGSLK